MENDSVRSSGDSTVVDIWIAGKLRGVSVTREAIEAFLQLPPDRAATLTPEDRREFVRTHLGEVITAATTKLHETSFDAATVVIEPGDVRRPERRPTVDRRKGGDRRKGDRRTGDRRPPGEERRRT